MRLQWQGGRHPKRSKAEFWELSRWLHFHVTWLYLEDTLCEGKEINAGWMVPRGRVLPQEKQLCFSPEESSISLLAASWQASWMTFRVTDTSLRNQQLKKKCLRIAQAAFSPPFFWGVTGLYAGLVVRSMLRLWTDMWALRLAGNLRSGCRQCQCIPGTSLALREAACLPACSPTRLPWPLAPGEGCLACCWRG